jgi:hypothetical protein
MPLFAPADITCSISYIFKDKNFKQKTHAQEWIHLTVPQVTRNSSYFHAA